ncbi:MAG: class I SAM-dependent methyltransferase [Filifactor alocis]|nr:class I SAM-dependent methyltransferase [Filifactor alocis]
MAYEAVSRVYDALMEEVDYQLWCNFMEELFTSKTEGIRHILELGCGSGIMTEKLLEKGYEVVGADVSEEMLELAWERVCSYGNKAILMQQDIRDLDFEIYEIDCILSSNDTFNYLTQKAQLEELFSYLYARLKVGGSLVFDISSEYKLSTVLGDRVYGQSFEDMAYLWENEYDEQSRELTIRVNVFEQEGEVYRRYEEVQVQKAYFKEEIVELLEKTGYKDIEVYGDFSREPIEETCERWFFCAIK